MKNFLINVVDRNNKAAQAQDQAQTLVRKLREAKITQIFEGTNQIQRLVIGRSLNAQR